MSNYVLIVDDNSSDRKVARIIVEKEGFVGITAENAHEALDKLEEYDFKLFIIDIQMPVMSGLDLLKRLKRTSEVKDVPTLIMSGRNTTEDIKQAISSGATDYAVKPLDSQVLSAKVSQLLAGKKTDWVECCVEEPAEISIYLKQSCELISINEIGATIRCAPHFFKEGDRKMIGGGLFRSLEIDSLPVHCNKIRLDEDGNTIASVNFVGLEESDRKRIRKHCNVMWVQKKKAG